MKIVLQRVRQAEVSSDGMVVASIGQGLLLLVGVAPEDTRDDIAYAVRKISRMRLFADADGKMTYSLKDVGGEVLSVSQFTLFAKTKKGNRPDFTAAARPLQAKAIYEAFNQALADEVPTKVGIFGADMQISLINDGPVTILLDTKNP